MINTKKTVYFVRHGQSEHNVAPVFQAEDSPLSSDGNKQANLVAERASRLNFETIIASPLPRASETAQAISKKTKKKIVFSDLFVERTKPKSINGKPYTDEIANKTWRQWEKSMVTAGMRVEDGENYDDIIVRAKKALDYLLERPEKSILVVTHGYFLRTIVARVLLAESLNPAAFKNFHRAASIENTGITVLQYRDDFEQDHSWRLWTYNDHAHLAN